MSAIHRGYMAAHRSPDGGLVIDQANDSDNARFWFDTDPRVLNAVPDPDVQVEADDPLPIPAQRAGSAYEQKVLAADDDLADLSDLSDLVPIPGMRAFALNYLRNNPETPEGGTR